MIDCLTVLFGKGELVDMVC